MTVALAHFRDNIARCVALEVLYAALSTQVTAAVDLTDILRAELVMAVSALDYYVHELVRIGMLEAHDGRRPQTQSYMRFSVSLDAVTAALAGDPGWLEAQVRLRHGHLSFQMPDKVAEAARLISDAQLWRGVADHLGETEDAVKTRLRLIVERRNKIAHEADADPTTPGQRWPIDSALAIDARSFLEELAAAIDAVVGEPQQWGVPGLV